MREQEEEGAGKGTRARLGGTVKGVGTEQCVETLMTTNGGVLVNLKLGLKLARRDTGNDALTLTSLALASDCVRIT